MTTEARVAAVEEAVETIANSVLEIKEQVGLLVSNGAFTITFKDKRVKFAGSLPFPKPIYIALAVAALGGSGWLTKFLGAW